MKIVAKASNLNYYVYNQNDGSFQVIGMVYR